MGDEREEKGQKQHYHLSLSFRKTEEKEWERGDEKKEREQNFYGLYLRLFSHMPKKRT